jgi:dipeptidyl aminopeptidase/acylaminoacyl peptidase
MRRVAAIVAGVLVFAPPADAAFPGRDGLIAFARVYGTGVAQIYVMRPDGSHVRQLTHRRGGADRPGWSPDGRRIAFSGRGSNGTAQVFVMRADGSGVRQITHGKDDFYAPAWSPDGRWIVATRGHWTPAGDRTAELVSPIFADLTGLPPLLIQAGSHEILLDDATRLAARAAGADVAVRLEVTPGVPHVFQGFAAMLDEADAALTSAGEFLRAHLAG